MSNGLIKTIVADMNDSEKALLLPPPYSLVDDAATQLLKTFEKNLTAMTIEELGNKIRENGFKLKVYKAGQQKPNRIAYLIEVFNKYCDDIKSMNRIDLFDICRDNKISGYSTLKKDELVQLILELTANCKQIKFADKVSVADNKVSVADNKAPIADNKATDKVPVTENKAHVADNKVDNNTGSNAYISELELMKKKLDDQIEKEKERVEKERVERERIERERIERERIERERIEKEKMEKERLKAEKAQKAEQKVKTDTQIISDEDPEKKKKKQTIPKSVKTHVWDLYIGKHINEHRCLCCKKSYIQITNFDTGHVLSEKDGGTHEISNLRPICAVCNHSMGSENMIDFVKRYGYYIG